MSAQLLDGKKLAKTITESLRERVEAVRKRRGRAPGLLIVGGGDAAADSYAGQQIKACKALGLAVQETRALDAFSIVSELDRRGLDAFLLQQPLPESVDSETLLAALPPSRDAEGATPFNFGKLFEMKRYDEVFARKLVAPCTALAIAELLRATNLPLAGKTAVVLGRSNIVGKPAAHLLSCLDLTVTLCHSKTRDLAALVSKADVVVAAIGKAKLVKADWIKEGAVVLDAGTNQEGKGFVGDVDPAAAERAAFYTPVPGGVGPVTTAMLLANTVALAERTLR